jgi:ribosomal protein L7/L12
MRVRIVGWKEGLQKISLNRLLREYNTDFSLSSAKKAVDDILDDKVVEFNLSDDFAKDFAIKASEIGAIVEID